MGRSIPRLAAWVATLILLAAVAVSLSSASNRRSDPAAPATRNHVSGDGASPAALAHQPLVHIGIRNLAFQPARVVIAPGTEVVWTNLDPFQHTATSDSGMWTSGSLNPGKHFGLVFRKAGTYRYHCAIHPFIHGVIVVRLQTRMNTAAFFPSLLAGAPGHLRLAGTSHF